MCIRDSQYIFEGNGYEITLLYEPSIWIDRSNACTNLYSTGYNFIKSKWNDKMCIRASLNSEHPPLEWVLSV